MFIEKKISKELSGNWELNIKAIANEYTAPNRDDIIIEEGQEFRVVNVEKERSFEETYINVKARHKCFDLEDIYVCKGKVTADFERDNINIDSGYDGWQVNYQFKGTLQEHLDELFKFTSAFAVGSVPADTSVRTVTVSEGPIFDNFKKILDRFNCGFELNSTSAVSEVSAFEFNELLGGVTGLYFNYGENNINMSRNDPYEDIISHLYAEAVIVPTDGSEEYNHIHEVGSGYPEYFVDFGKLETELELQNLADAYYNIRSNPQPKYSIDAAELKKLPSELTPGDITPSDYNFSVGNIVYVNDPGLGINNEKVAIVGHDYSLLEDEYTSTYKLGTLDSERLPPDFEIFETKATNIKSLSNAQIVKEIAKMTRDYIKDNIFGGDVKDINSDLLKYANRFSAYYPGGVGWESPAFSTQGTFAPLENITNGFSNYLDDIATVYSDVPETFDPVDFIREEVEDPISKSSFTEVMEFWIDTYIDTATNLPSSINAIFSQLSDETGTTSSATINDSPDHINTRINSMDLTDPLSWQFEVQSIISYALGRTGNPTEIYTQVGGGRNGFIPAINELWQLARDMGVVGVETDGTESQYNNPRIYSSEEDPMVDKGKNGDVWLKYEVEDSGS